MPLYNLCFSVCETIEADNEDEALEILANDIKDMRFCEFCYNTEIDEIKDNKEEKTNE